jgi:3-hydroxybutyryl-CoA dehydrogenase
MAIQKVGIVGSGTMGAGIAQVSAKAGLQVVIARVTSGPTEQVRDRVAAGFQRDLKKGKMTEDEVKAIMDRVQATNNLEDLRDCDLVIESIIEDIGAKQELFKKLDAICKPETILASNTSTLCIAELRVGVKRFDKFAGVHFFNPVPAMKLVEIILPIGAAPELNTDLGEYVAKVGKTAVMVKDMPGYVVNRLLVPLLVEAIRAFEQGIATMKDLDTATQLGLGHPMGPLALADLIGLDVVMAMAENLSSEFMDTRFAPPPLLKRMLLSGYLGKKSKMGFYNYSGEAPVPNEWLAGAGELKAAATV